MTMTLGPATSRRTLASSETPVIGWARRKRVMMRFKSKSGTTFHQRLHALSPIDGSEKFTGPRDSLALPAVQSMAAAERALRPGTGERSGVHRVCFARRSEHVLWLGGGLRCLDAGFHGCFNDDPTSSFGGVWMVGGAPAADSSNNLYVITGNGVWNGTTQFGRQYFEVVFGQPQRGVELFHAQQ